MLAVFSSIFFQMLVYFKNSSPISSLTPKSFSSLFIRNLLLNQDLLLIQIFSGDQMSHFSHCLTLKSVSPIYRKQIPHFYGTLTDPWIQKSLTLQNFLHRKTFLSRMASIPLPSPPRPIINNIFPVGIRFNAKFNKHYLRTITPSFLK